MKLVFDTQPLVSFFKGDNDNVQKLLELVESSKFEYVFISAVSISELFYIFSRFRNIELAEIVLNHIKHSRIVIVPVSTDIAEGGGKFKFKYSKEDISLADCIIAATALKENAILVSEDPGYKKIKEIAVKNAQDIVKNLLE